jgi:outer membrane protein assembly factor BamB
MLVRPNYISSIVSGLLALVLAGQSASAQQSVTYQITPAHDGAADFAQGLTLPLQRAWSRSFPHTLSYPVVADGKVFVNLSHDSFTTTGSKVVAMALADGRTLWQKTIPGSLHWSASTYDNGRLFVVNDDGIVYAFNPETGTLFWRKRIPGKYVPPSVNAPPTARNGLVYISDSAYGVLHALDQVTGDVIWSQRVAYGSASSPTLSPAGGLFVAYPCQVYKFAAKNGKLRWHLDGGCVGGGGSTTVLYSDHLYANYGEGPTYFTYLHKFDLSGADLGTLPSVVGTPAFYGGIGYFRRSDRLSALSEATGDSLWEFTGAARPALPPVIVNGKVIVTSEAGQLFVLDATTGNELQRITLGIPIPFFDETSSYRQRSVGAGENMVIVPADTKLFAFKGAN